MYNIENIGYPRVIDDISNGYAMGQILWNGNPMVSTHFM